MAYIPCVYWLANKPPGVYIASNTFGSSWIPAVCIDLSVWFLLNISHPVLLHHGCICAIVAVQNQVAENEKSPCEKWKGTCSSLWYPWALSVTLRLHLHNSLGFNRATSDLYLHVWEETQVPQGLWQLSASKNQVLAAEKDQIPKFKVNGCLFFYSFCFLCEHELHRSLHRHFQYRCGCSNYCLFFWRNLHLQNRAGYESRWTCCLKEPSVTSWSSKVRNSGMSCLARQGLQHMLCLVGYWKV